MSNITRVGLLLVRHGHLAAVLRGVHRYARPGRDWVFMTAEHSPQWIDRMIGWRPDGFIGFLSSNEELRGLRNTGRPVVTVASSVDLEGAVTVGLDDRAIGRMAADHFLLRGYRSFGVAAYQQHAAGNVRRAGYAERTHDAGWAVSGYTHTHFAQSPSPEILAEALASASDWLIDLPKPVAIFCVMDSIALFLSEACREADLRVPEDVAILGVDNDDLLCQMAYPPLSSIQVPSEQLGYEAARVLDEMMQGQQPPARPIRLKPISVVERRSTDVVAIDDQEVAAVLAYIRAHAGEPITVDDALTPVRISRRLLEQRFKAALGRTPLQEIHRVRVERAKQILISTDRTVQQVAYESGFNSAKRLEVVFQRVTGLTPTGYRRQNRLD